jgi:hypothetical protein
MHMLCFVPHHVLIWLSVVCVCVPQGYVGKNFRNISIKVSWHVLLQRA